MSQPLPGDVIRVIPGQGRMFTESRRGPGRPVLLVINGTNGIAEDEYMTTALHEFGGYNPFWSDDEVINGHLIRGVVDCSGGPCPFVKSSELRDSGEMMELVCWKWKDRPRKDGGVNYTRTVRIWDWDV